jgi:hypothetical protein
LATAWYWLALEVRDGQLAHCQNLSRSRIAGHYEGEADCRAYSAHLVSRIAWLIGSPIGSGVGWMPGSLCEHLIRYQSPASSVC